MKVLIVGAVLLALSVVTPAAADGISFNPPPLPPLRVCPDGRAAHSCPPAFHGGERFGRWAVRS